jgi:signal transduction histidine kinase
MARSSIRVLLVEDNPDDADVLRELLADAGADEFHLVHVERLGDALEELGKSPFDLVLLDLSLPDCHGIETLTRALAHSPGVPIVVLTGMDDERLGMIAVHTGAQDYIVKTQVDVRWLARCMRYAVERHQLLAEKTSLIGELERSNTIKTYFAATMSHELRGTLGVIILLTEMVSENATGEVPAEHQRAMQLVNERANESLQLIQATLELTRSEASGATSEAQEICVAELLDQVARDIVLPAEKRNLRVDWRIGTSLPRLRSDPVKIKMVMKNLIGNAIKFTQQGGITVAVATDNGGLRLSVTDTGIGIASEDIPALFEPFRQGHGMLSRHAGGAGLGLYIVGRLTDMLGGRIEVDSEPGRGSTFSVLLPLTPPPR